MYLLILIITIITVGLAGANSSPNICIARQTGTLVRNVKDCSTYFHCFNEIPILLECPVPQLFNQITGACDLAERVECFTCPEDEFFIDLPVVNECNQFVRCFNNQSEQLICAEGLIFDRQLKMCNYADVDVKCPFEVLCPKIHDSPIFTRDRDNCSKYY